MSTIRNAEQIIVFNKGEIAENGTHDELMALNGIFRQLIQAQEIGKGDDEFVVDGQLIFEFVALNLHAFSSTCDTGLRLIRRNGITPLYYLMLKVFIFILFWLFLLMLSVGFLFSLFTGF